MKVVTAGTYVGRWQQSTGPLLQVSGAIWWHSWFGAWQKQVTCWVTISLQVLCASHRYIRWGAEVGNGWLKRSRDFGSAWDSSSHPCTVFTWMWLSPSWTFQHGCHCPPPRIFNMGVAFPHLRHRDYSLYLYLIPLFTNPRQRSKAFRCFLRSPPRRLPWMEIVH